MQSEQLSTPTETPASKQRHYLAAFFLSFMWGTYGVDRFYLGYYFLGILKLLTLGGFGLWTLIDFIVVASGKMKDRQGREMLQVDEYKSFTKKFLLIFALVLIVLVSAIGAAAIYAVTQIMTELQANGGIEGILQDLFMQQMGIDFDPSQLESLNY